MNLWVNGERAEINGVRTVAELAKHYELPPNSVLIEHNQVALHQREWTARELAEDDRLEFVRVVAGG